MHMRKFAFAIAAIVLTSTAASAGWREEISAHDAERLSQLAQSRAQGLAEAQSGAPADLAAIHSVLDARAVPASAKALTGDWRCRTIKLGGVTPDIVYAWFRCRISPRSGALLLEKLTGSTRTSGTLYPEGEGFIYLGASTVKGEALHAYSGNGAGAGAEATPDDQVGLLSLLADGRARLELPFPLQESSFDVLELKR